MNDNKVYISDSEKIISGVCGGLADKMNIDPTIVRVVVVILSFVTGFWITCLAYYLFTLFMPTREDDVWRELHSTKKVKNVFLYSLVVFVVYSPILLGALYLMAIAMGITMACLI